MQRRGLFFTFEGGEGTGKTTQIRLLKEYLEQAGRRVCVTFEPGGTEIGEKIRHLLLNTNWQNMSARCEVLLYAASRAQHVHEIIRPALQRGEIVLCDRYWDASRAYQGVARQLGIQSIDQINAWATDDLRPHKVFVFDLDAQQGIARARERANNQGLQLDRIESESELFHRRVHQAYLYLALSDPQHYVLLNAAQPVELIQKDIIRHVEEFLI